MHALRIPIAVILGGAVHDRRCSGCSGAWSARRSTSATVPRPRASSSRACAATPKLRRSATRRSSASVRPRRRRRRAWRSRPGGIDNNVAQLTPIVDARGAMSRMTMSAGSDRDVIPLVRINPDYPPRALSRGLEGWVQVQFTITPTGTVADAGGRQRRAEEHLRRRGAQGDRALALQPEGRGRRRRRACRRANDHSFPTRAVTLSSTDSSDRSWRESHGTAS